MKKQTILIDSSTLKLYGKGHDYYWFGRVSHISPDNDIELTIHVEDRNNTLTRQTKLIAEFADNYEKLMTMLYEYICNSFAAFGKDKSSDELRKMYFLTAVELKKNNEEWYVTLEPMPDIETIYNHFLRFTISNNLITWSNL